jgi:hypothetical protein
VAEPILLWFKDSVFAHFITGYRWAWPVCETLHFVGMVLLIGVVGVVDLRMIGLLKKVSFEPLHRLLPWGIAGFIINAITGFLFFTGDAEQYFHNPAFQLKMLFIALAGINVIVFYLFPFRSMKAIGPGDDAPMMAKVIAGTSIFLWLGVVFWGRMLPFIGSAF